MALNEAQVIETIRKLLALSESPNRHEAEVAAEKAASLMASHSISMGQVAEPVAGSVYGEGRTQFADVHAASWRWGAILAAFVAEAYGLASCFTDRNGGIVRFFGRADTVRIAVEIYSGLTRAMLSVWAAEKKRRRREKIAIGRGWDLAYLTGMAVAVGVRLGQAVEATTREAGEEGRRWELAKVDDGKAAFAELGPRNTQAAHLPSPRNQEGFHSGMEAGRSVALGFEPVLAGEAGGR